MQRIPPTVWNTFWVDVVNSAIYVDLDDSQRDGIKTAVYLSRYFSSPRPHVSCAWDDYLERLIYAAETALRFHTPGDEVLYDLKLWAENRIPPLWPP